MFVKCKFNKYRPYIPKLAKPALFSLYIWFRFCFFFVFRLSTLSLKYVQFTRTHNVLKTIMFHLKRTDLSKVQTMHVIHARKRFILKSRKGFNGYCFTCKNKTNRECLLVCAGYDKVFA